VQYSDSVPMRSGIPFVLKRAEWTTLQTQCYSKNVEAPGLEPGNSRSAARNSDHWTTEGVILEWTNIKNRVIHILSLHDYYCISLLDTVLQACILNVKFA
jgi:hypothetical protein